MSQEHNSNPETLERATHIDFQYLNLLRDILKNGIESEDRTGTGTKKVSGRMLKCNLQEGFPLLTTKKIWFKGVKEELLWFIKGERNIRPLLLKGVNIWNEWPFKNYLKSQGLLGDVHPKRTPELWDKMIEEFVIKIKEDERFANQWGDLGPVYGYQWRHWQAPDGKEIDQLQLAIDTIKNNPDSRRIVVTAWNPAEIENMSLPPCHMTFQFQVAQDRLNCMMYQRSVDSFLGLPFNIASYALLTEIVAKVTNYEPGELTLFLGDTHIYLDHLAQVNLQLNRDPKQLPHLLVNPLIKDINSLSSEDFLLEGYQPHPHIPASISV